MGLKTKLKPTEKAILRHVDAFAPSLDLQISHLDIVDKFNAFDWLDLHEARNEVAVAAVVMRFFESFNFRFAEEFGPIIIKAFTLKFGEAVEYLSEAINEVHHSYNVEGGSKGFQNDVVNKFYYIQYWADKKNIAVNYNDKNQKNRELFNLDTIILNILADKLRVLNEYERNKPKK